MTRQFAYGVLLIAAYALNNGFSVDIGGITVEPNKVKVSEKTVEFLEPEGENKGREMKRTFMSFDTQRIVYTIAYSRYSSPGADGKFIKDGHTGIGIWGPTLRNWCCYDFIRIVLDERPLEFERGVSWKISESRDKGAQVVFSFNDEKADVNLSFFIPPEDNKLFLEVAIDRKTPITSVKILFRNYPGFLTTMKKPGKRWMVSATHDEMDDGERQKRVVLNLPEDYWVFFGDKVYDVDNNKAAEGPSGFMFVPEEASVAEVILMDHLANTVTITYKPDIGRYHVVLWEFANEGNKSALEGFISQTRPCQELMNRLYKRQ